MDRGAPGSSKRARFCRVLAATGACALAAQSMQLPLLAADDRAACCCAHKEGDPDCQCPVCAHDRELKSGKPFLKTCTASHPTAAIAAREPGVPLVAVAVSGKIASAPVSPRIASPPPQLAPDVPTPPPLARA